MYRVYRFKGCTGCMGFVGFIGVIRFSGLGGSGLRRWGFRVFSPTNLLLEHREHATLRGVLHVPRRRLIWLHLFQGLGFRV